MDKLVAATGILFAILWMLIGIAPILIGNSTRDTEFEMKLIEEELNEQQREN